MHRTATITDDAAPPSHSLGLSRPSILIVDDDLELRQLVSIVLRRKGWQTIEASNGREALQCLSSASLPDLILLDLNMPVMDGWEFRKRQLQDPRLAGVPVVVVSAQGLCDKTAGLAPTVLRKPVDLSNLLAAVTPFQKSEASSRPRSI